MLPALHSSKIRENLVIEKKISKCPIFSCISRLYRPLCNFKENSLPLLHTAPLGMQCFICSLILLLFKGQEGYCISYKGPCNMQMNAKALGFFFFLGNACIFELIPNFPNFLFFQTGKQKYTNHLKYILRAESNWSAN